MGTAVRDDVIGLTPLERPDVGLVVAAWNAGILGVLDLGRDPSAAQRALAATSQMVRAFGVRVPDPRVVDTLPVSVTTVIVTTSTDIARFLPRRVLVQVTSLEDARAAVAAGASGVIAKGCEAGGRIGEIGRAHV